MNANLVRLDILVNNAGIMMCPNWRTKQGFEMQFGVNHLGHFLLTNLLLDLMKKTSLPYCTGRIVNVSSRAHYDFGINWSDINWEKSYSPIRAYAQSKLSNVLFTKELANRLKDTGIVAVSLHPGVVRTELIRYMGDSIFGLIPILYKIFLPIFCIFSKSVKEGAQTTIYCSVDENVSRYSGCYFSDCKVKKPSEEARNKEFATRLWDISEKLVKI
jgi:NAD(P)-dependent dehydrogenase (short-subunit alcohol dehydrogenase family)